MTLATKQFVFGDIGHCLAFGLGAGLVPKMPGTAGTVLALPLYYAVVGLSLWAQWALFVLLFGGGIWLCGRAGRALGSADDGGIVLDEIAAFYVVLLCTPAGFWWQAAAFILFRFFDMTKPPPIGWLDKNLGGGFGVMIDDIAAALLTLLLLFLVRL